MAQLKDLIVNGPSRFIGTTNIDNLVATGTLNGFTLGKSVPSNAVFTDTTYSIATTSANGLMSSIDKSKLDGIASGATAVSSSTVSGWGFAFYDNSAIVNNSVYAYGLSDDYVSYALPTSANGDEDEIFATQTWVNNSSKGSLAWASYTTATTVASVPIGYKIVKCTISASASFSLASTSVTAGREIHVIVNNSGSSDIVISLPTTGAYVNLSEDSLTIPAAGYAEINIISDGSKLYIRTLA